MGGERPLLPRIKALTRQAYGQLRAIVQWAVLHLKYYYLGRWPSRVGAVGLTFYGSKGLGLDCASAAAQTMGLGVLRAQDGPVRRDGVDERG
jgi:hypothetical protein